MELTEWFEGNCHDGEGNCTKYLWGSVILHWSSMVEGMEDCQQFGEDGSNDGLLLISSTYRGA
jgi:hypothetical protein